MAQLKDLLVSGPSRFIGDMFGTNLQITTIKAPTASGGSTYGAGTSGQALMSNGNSVYWGTPITDLNSMEGTLKIGMGGTGAAGGFNANGVIYYTATAGSV